MTRYEYRIMRDGAHLLDLRVPSDSVPTVDWSASAEIKRSCSVQCAPEPNVNWLTDELQIVQITDGTEIPRGRFFVPTRPIEFSRGAGRLNLTGYDHGYLLRNLAALEHVETIPAGTVVTTAVNAQLVSAGILKVLLTPSSAVTLTDHEYEAGTTRYEIISGLLQEINYRDIWFDGLGRAVVEPWTAAGVDTIEHHYYAGEASICTDALTEEEDTFAAANVFIELVSSADLSADMRAESVNDYLSSPLSVTRRGRRIVDIETLDIISSQAALQARADYRKLRSLMSSRTISWTSGAALETIDHGLNDCCAIDRESIGLVEEQDWKIECKPGGLMTHTGKKVFYAL